MAHRSFFGITQGVGEELLTCPICCEKYDGSTKIAKFLPCFHTFCVHCIGLHAKDQRIFKCPLCRRDVEVPVGGVERFTNNFMVTKLKDLEHLINADVNKPSGLRCGACKEAGVAVGFCRHVDCLVFLCQHCDAAHKRMLDFESHCTVSIEQLQQDPGIQLPPQKTNCDIHKSKPLELFCNEEQCQIPICLLCATTSHQGHGNVVLDQKSSEVKKELKSLAEAAKQKITPVKEISNKIGSEIDSTNRRIDEVSSHITKIFNGIHEMLNARKDKIVAELEQIRSEQTSCLQRQSDRAQSQASQLESAYQFAERARDIGNPVDLLQTRKQVISSLHELIGRDIDTLLPTRSTDEAYVAVEENDECLLQMESLISRLGNLQTHCVTVGANITWNVTFPDQDVSCLPVKVPQTVQIRCDHAAVVDLDRLGGRFNVVLIAPDESSTECVDYYLTENFLEYCFQPLVTGTHHLSISLSGVPISGSPFELTVIEDPAEGSSSNGVKTQVPISETTSIDVTWSDAFARCTHTIFLKLHGASRLILSAENLTAKYTMSDSPYQSKIDNNTETGDAHTAKFNEVTAEIEETDTSNTLKIVYTPEKAGQVNMTIFADGEPIAGSPFVINVDPLHPHATTVSGERMGACPPNTAVLDMPYHLDVVTYDYLGKRLTTGGYNITAAALPTAVETSQVCDVIDNQNGSYRITYTPRLRKTHTVSINICGLPVHLEKPLVFFVNESLSFQDPPGGYKSPSSLTFDKERETVYVADAKKGAIISFKTDGSFVKSLQLQSMRKSDVLIAVDAADTLVMLIPKYKSISTLSIGTKLEEEYSWTCNEVQKVASLALSPNGHLVVGDSKSQNLFIYELKSGEFTRKIPLPHGSLASGMSNFCIDSQDEILVARHSEPYQVLRYSLEGNELSSLSSPVQSNQLAIATTSEGHVIVAAVDAILVMEGDTLGIIKAIPTGDQIYTGIVVTNDRCFVGFEPGLKHIAKYSYNVE